MSWRVFQFYCKQKIIFKSLHYTNFPKMPFYAVARGRTTGIFMNWNDCEAQVKGFPGSRYKKFNTAADAETFIMSESGTNPSQKNKSVKTSESNYNFNGPHTINSQNQSELKTAKKRKSKSTEGTTERDLDLNIIITKQMDDIEKRLQSFEKGVDKIIKKSSKNVGQTILIDPPQPKKRRSGKFEFEEDQEGFVQVYTDGACSANGKSGARAGIGVYWGVEHPLNVSEPVTGRATNNCGEIQAATCAIKVALQNKIKKLKINTDSKFLINSVTKWMPGWKRKGWKLQSGEPVKNEKDFKELDEIKDQLEIKWNYVEAHRGVHGNEMADQLSKAGAAKYTK